MARIGDEPALRLLGLLQAVEELVEGDGQPVDLVVRGRDRQTFLEVPGRDPLGLLADGIHRAQGSPGEDVGDGRDDHDHQGDAEDQQG